jgi:alkylation response protein AidB-like acyl-CoA dehydrogenase
MDWGFSPAEEAFRDEVREKIQARFTPEILQREGLANSPARKKFVDELARDGWLGSGWPEEYGGHPATPMMRIIVHEELAYAGAPNLGIGVLSVGQAILRFGSAATKERFLPRILTNEILFAFGYTEPHAGSDLANLHTAAVRDGGEYVVNGVKRFITPAHYADYLWTAVRTDPDAPRRQGISMLIIPLDSPGIEVEEIVTLGRWRTNEVTLNDVRVSAELLVGEENQGWRVITAALNDERLYPHSPLRRSVEQLLEWARTPGPDGRVPADEEDVRHTLVTLVARMEASYGLYLEQVDAMVNERDSTAEAAINKLYLTEVDGEIMNQALDLFGPVGLAEAEDPDAVLAGVFTRDYRASPLGTIAGGSSEVLRNLVARHALGLPRE